MLITVENGLNSALSAMTSIGIRLKISGAAGPTTLAIKKRWMKPYFKRRDTYEYHNIWKHVNKKINILGKAAIFGMDISESVPNKEPDFALKMKIYA